MNHKDFRILGLAASLRRASFHRGIVRAAHELAPERMSCEGFDLALTRFSGKQVSLPEDTDSVTLEAYSHEVVSFGFWPGDASVREPAFYSYAAPEPEGLTEHPLSPGAASWLPEGGTALLLYEQIRNNSSPKETLLEFIESAYQAGAKSAGWDIEAFQTHPPVREAAKLMANIARPPCDEGVVLTVWPQPLAHRPRRCGCWRPRSWAWRWRRRARVGARDRAEHQGYVADGAGHRAIDRERGTSVRLRPEDNK